MPISARWAGQCDAKCERARIHLCAGCAAGAVSSVVVAPLEVVKTRLQAQWPAVDGGRKYTGMRQALQMVWREERFRGLMRGLSPTLLALVPTHGVYFSVYEATKAALTRHESPGSAAPSTRTGRMEIALGASTAAGLCTAVITHPLWVIARRMQFNPTEFPSIHRTIKVSIAHEGSGALVKGLAGSLLGVSHVMVQFPVLEFIKELFHEHRKTIGTEREHLSSTEVGVAAGLSKMFASCVTYPHEVLRARIMTDRGERFAHSQFTGRLRLAFRESIAKEGFYALYHGLGTNLVRTVPSFTLTYLLYDTFVSQLEPL